MDRILEKNLTPSWFQLLEDYRIYLPLQKKDNWYFEVQETPGEIPLDYLNTLIPPKSFVFPQREMLFQFSTQKNGGNPMEEFIPKVEPSIIFGIRPCDAAAIQLVTEVFRESREDVYVTTREKDLVLAGLACTPPPSPNCFCTSMEGSPFSTRGLDLLLTDLGNSYYIESVTTAGEKLIIRAGELLNQPSSGAKKQLENIRENRKNKPLVRTRHLKQVVEELKDSFDRAPWEETAMSCIGCGICTYLCPTCHCYDINDEVSSSTPLEGKRVRTWDSCQFPDFTMHSSGHNPRPNKAARLRRRILHKFLYHKEQTDRFLCTGCGRCTSLCPVGLDIIKVLDKVSNHG